MPEPGSEAANGVYFINTGITKTVREQFDLLNNAVGEINGLPSDLHNSVTKNLNLLSNKIDLTSSYVKK